MTLLFTLAAPSGCAPATHSLGTMHVTTNGAVVASMANHKTYAFESVAPAPPSSVQWTGAAGAIQSIKTNVDREMQGRGYVLDPEPGLVIRISIGTHQQRDDATGSAAVFDAPSTTDQMIQLHIDVFDRANGGHLFHGVAKDELHSPEPEAEQLAKQVRLIFEPVPRSAR